MLATIGAKPASAATPGTITTIAGGDAPGPSPATTVALNTPTAVASAGGSIYLAEPQWGVIRKVDSSDSETVVAGVGALGYSGDGGPATSAELSYSQGVAVDASGDVFIADTSNDRVRMVATNTGTYFGQAMTKGDIYTIAGKGDNGGYGGYSGDGGPGTAAQLSNDVPNLAVDPSGNVVIADGYNSRVRVVAASTGSFYGQAMTEGDIYTIAGDGTFGYSGDGGPATSAELYMPYGLDVRRVRRRLHHRSRCW